VTDGVALILSFVGGLVLGAGMATAVLYWAHGKSTRLQVQSQQEREQSFTLAISELKTAFSALSRDALSANAEDFLKLASTRLERQTAEGDQTLDTKKRLIDARLEEMNAKLAAVSLLMQAMEKQRAEWHGSLAAQLEKTNQTAHQLHETTSRLREALANPQRRGQWGERMAEDILRLVGLVEGTNYHKQLGQEGGRPDFTFLLPGDRVVHMDVKFPLANYMKMLEAGDDPSRAAAKSAFLKDVRSRIREITDRGYIDAGGRSLDLLLLFIPNDQIYSFIHEADPDLLDESLKRRVVLSSPTTLYALLCILREAVDRFRVEMTSVKVLELLGRFKAEWENYVKTMSGMGKKLDDAVDAYQQLVGVRTRQLDRQLDKIEALRATGGDLTTDAVASASAEVR